MGDKTRVGPEMSIEGKISKLDAQMLHFFHVEPYMLLLFFEGIGQPFAKVGRCFGTGK